MTVSFALGADPYGLDRFLEAQEDGYARALVELTRGRKVTHWMWFIFPQVAGLGRKGVVQRYAIDPLSEAQAFIAKPVLGVRYRSCVALLQDLVGTTAETVLGSVDAAKLRSSLTLFAIADRRTQCSRQRLRGGSAAPATHEPPSYLALIRVVDR